MNSKNNIWFNASGCLQPNAINAILKGDIPTAIKPAIDTHLHECELCRIAVKGFEGNPIKGVNVFASLNDDITTRIQLKMKQKERKRKTNISLVISIAASLLLFIGVYYTLEIKQVPGGGYLAMNENSVIIPIDSIDVVPLKIPLDKPISELTFMKPQPLNSNYIAKRKVRNTESSDKNEITKDDNLLVAADADQPLAEVTDNKASRTSVTYVAKAMTAEADVAVEEEELAVVEKEVIAQPSSSSISKVAKPTNSRFVNGKDLYKSRFDDANQKFASYEVITEVDESPHFDNTEYKSFSDYLKQQFEAIYGDQKMLNKEVKYRFVINKSGGVESPEIIKGGTSELNDQVFKILTASPRWQPGLIDSLNVSVIVNLKIKFE